MENGKKEGTPISDSGEEKGVFSREDGKKGRSPYSLED